MILKQKNLAKYREIQLKKQQGIDPITKEFIKSPTLDHDHVTNKVRMVLDRNTNQFEGRIISFYNRLIKYKNLPITLSDILRNLAVYLEQDYSNNPYHPMIIKSSARKFKNLKKEHQFSVLKEFGILPDKNVKLRVKQYLNLISHES